MRIFLMREKKRTHVERARIHHVEFRVVMMMSQTSETSLNRYPLLLPYSRKGMFDSPMALLPKNVTSVKQPTSLLSLPLLSARRHSLLLYSLLLLPPPTPGFPVCHVSRRLGLKTPHGART